MSEDAQKTILVKPGLSPTILALLLAGSVAMNLWFGVKHAQVSVQLAQREQAEQIITNNYYGFLNWVKQEFNHVKTTSQNQGFFAKLFPPRHPAPDLSVWDNPYDDRTIDKR
jgi:hypothetical protein